VVKHGKLTYEFNKITKYISIGTNQCCVAHFRSSLIRKGIVADLSVEKERLDAAWGAKYFLWLPVVDHSAPTHKQFLLGASFIKHCVQQKVGVYVHCQRGHGRAPTMVAAYLIGVKGMTPKQAVEFIKNKRKSIHPNKNQMAALKRFHTYVKKKGNKAI